MAVAPQASSRISLAQGDITRCAADAIVNAANETLLGGGGVDGAIHRAAGPGLRAECAALGGCAPGEAKITRGHQLPASHVIHTVGPRWHGGSAGEAGVLASCYRNSLELARKHGLATIAFPSIGTGAFGFPIERAAPVVLATTIAWLEEHPDFKHVWFICFNEDDLRVYRHALDALPAG